MIKKRIALAALTTVAASVSAHANVTISTAATQNMSCSSGTCVPTATNAVLNVNDLENDLSQYGNVKVMTTGNGVEANDIVVNAAFSSPDSTSLTLAAHRALTIHRAVSVGSGTAELELQHGKPGMGGKLVIGRNGHITFASLSDIFGVNGVIFTLVGSVQQLASAVHANRYGAFALANTYDASTDGTYSNAPVKATFQGTVEGLGNVIENLKIDVSDDFPSQHVGLISNVGPSGHVRDIGVTGVSITITGIGVDAGALVGANQGRIVNAYATGAVSNNGGGHESTGGLVAANAGTIDGCYAIVNVVDADEYSGSGGLVGANSGHKAIIEQSFATGSVTGGISGGLVGTNGYGAQGDAAQIVNSYSEGPVSGSSEVGGFIGENAYGASITSSYSTGQVTGDTGAPVGGFVGSYGGSIGDSYWDKTTSGTTSGTGGGNVSGITGVTTKKLQTGLPSGFDSSIWAENPNVNNGFPYLIDYPPPE